MVIRSQDGKFTVSDGPRGFRLQMIVYHHLILSPKSQTINPLFKNAFPIDAPSIVSIGVSISPPQLVRCPFVGWYRRPCFSGDNSLGLLDVPLFLECGNPHFVQLEGSGLGIPPCCLCQHLSSRMRVLSTADQRVGEARWSC